MNVAFAWYATCVSALLSFRAQCNKGYFLADCSDSWQQHISLYNGTRWVLLAMFAALSLACFVCVWATSMRKAETERPIFDLQLMVILLTLLLGLLCVFAQIDPFGEEQPPVMDPAVPQFVSLLAGVLALLNYGLTGHLLLSCLAHVHEPGQKLLYWCDIVGGSCLSVLMLSVILTIPSVTNEFGTRMATITIALFLSGLIVISSLYGCSDLLSPDSTRHQLPRHATLRHRNDAAELRQAAQRLLGFIRRVQLMALVVVACYVLVNAYEPAPPVSFIFSRTLYLSMLLAGTVVLLQFIGRELKLPNWHGPRSASLQLAQLHGRIPPPHTSGHLRARTDHDALHSYPPSTGLNGTGDLHPTLSGLGSTLVQHRLTDFRARGHSSGTLALRPIARTRSEGFGLGGNSSSSPTVVSTSQIPISGHLYGQPPPAPSVPLHQLATLPPFPVRQKLRPARRPRMPSSRSRTRSKPKNRSFDLGTNAHAHAMSVAGMHMAVGLGHQGPGYVGSFQPYTLGSIAALGIGAHRGVGHSLPGFGYGLPTIPTVAEQATLQIPAQSQAQLHPAFAGLRARSLSSPDGMVVPTMQYEPLPFPAAHFGTAPTAALFVSGSDVPHNAQPATAILSDRQRERYIVDVGVEGVESDGGGDGSGSSGGPATSSDDTPSGGTIVHGRFPPLRAAISSARHGATSPTPAPLHADSRTDKVSPSASTVVTSSSVSEIPGSTAIKVTTPSGSSMTIPLPQMSSLSPLLEPITWDPLESTCRHASLSIL